MNLHPQIIKVGRQFQAILDAEADSLAGKSANELHQITHDCRDASVHESCIIRTSALIVSAAAQYQLDKL